MGRPTASGRPTEKRNRKTSRIGLTPLEEHRLRRRLRRMACSETWVDHQIKSVYDQTADGRTIVCRFHDPQVFPPGGRQATAMRWCRSCGRYTPPNCTQLIEHRIRRDGPVLSATMQCDDCRIAIDDERYRELYEAGLHLRPASSFSFVRLAELFYQRRHGL